MVAAKSPPLEEGSFFERVSEHRGGDLSITVHESKIAHLKKRLCLTAKDAEGNGPAVRCTFFTFHFCRLPSALCRLPFPVDCSQTRLFGAVCITPSTHLQNLSPSSTYSGNQLERRS